MRIAELPDHDDIAVIGQRDNASPAGVMHDLTERLRSVLQFDGVAGDMQDLSVVDLLGTELLLSQMLRGAGWTGHRVPPPVQRQTLS